MLAQSLKSADELGITEPQRAALMKTLVLLETGKLMHAKVSNVWFPGSSDTFTGHFNMCQWNSAVRDCGTVACLGGTAELVGNVIFEKYNPSGNRALYRLFMPDIDESYWDGITPSQAATALRSYLTTGDAKWHEALVQEQR